MPRPNARREATPDGSGFDVDLEDEASQRTASTATTSSRGQAAARGRTGRAPVQQPGGEVCSGKRKLAEQEPGVSHSCQPAAEPSSKRSRQQKQQPLRAQAQEAVTSDEEQSSEDFEEMEEEPQQPARATRKGRPPRKQAASPKAPAAGARRGRSAAPSAAAAAATRAAAGGADGLAEKRKWWESEQAAAAGPPAAAAEPQRGGGKGRSKGKKGKSSSEGAGQAAAAPTAEAAGGAQQGSREPSKKQGKKGKGKGSSRTRGREEAPVQLPAAAEQGQQQQQQPTPSLAAAEAAGSDNEADDGPVAAGASGRGAAKAAAGMPAPPHRSPTPVAAAAVLEVSRPASPSSSAASEEAEAERSDQEFAAAAEEEEDPCCAANTWLMSRLRDPRGPEARGATLRPQLQAVHDQVVKNLENTIELQHNNSMLVMGPRGSGKTLVVERAVGAVCSAYNTDPKDPLVAVVRLVGYIHSEDRVAFREIARQLCVGFPQYTFSKSASVSENIDFLREVLKQLSKASKVAIFVLDGFDLFARRSKQALLYNLLDALVSSGMQAAVIGITTRQDVLEMLEKRVKSRFSHRKLDVVLPTGLRRRARPDWMGGGGGGGAAGGAVPEEDGMLDVLQDMLLLPPEFPHRQHAERFNAAVAAAVGAQPVSSALKAAMASCPTMDHLALVVEAVLRASYKAPNGLLTADMLVEAIGQLRQRQGDNVLAVSQLSVLELILLVAMQRLRAQGKTEMNFEMAHHEFRLYAQQGGHADTYSRAAAAKAFDHLITMGLVAFADARAEARAGGRQYAAVELRVDTHEVEAGAKQHWNCPHALAQWLQRQAGAGNTAVML